MVFSRNLSRFDRTKLPGAADVADVTNASPLDVPFDLDFLSVGDPSRQSGNGEFSVWFAVTDFGLGMRKGLGLLCHAGLPISLRIEFCTILSTSDALDGMTSPDPA